MEKLQTKPVPLTLRTSVLLIPVVFIGMLIIFWLTRQAFEWPSNDQQRTTAIYIAAGFSLIPIIIYLLSILSQNRAALGFKAFGTELTIDFSKNITTVPQSNLSSNLFTAGTYDTIAHSGSEEVIRAISRAANAPVVTVNIRDGRAWWLSRLFALSVGAMRLGLPDAIVFTATRENVEDTFIGWAEPRPIFDAIRRSYPEYEHQYMISRAIFNQLALSEDPGVASIGTLSSKAQFYQRTYNKGKELSFVQILLDLLNTSVESSTQKSPVWITVSLLSDLLGHRWHTKSVDILLSSEDQIEQIFEIETSYIPLVQQGKFVGMMESQLAMKVILKQIMSNETLNKA